MALKLTFTDPAWGEVTDSIHVISGIVNSNSKEKRCQFLVGIYKNAATLAAQKPLQVMTVICSGDDFDIVTGDTIKEEDLGTQIRVAQLKRAEAWMMTLNNVNGFDYTAATQI